MHVSVGPTIFKETESSEHIRTVMLNMYFLTCLIILSEVHKNVKSNALCEGPVVCYKSLTMFLNKYFYSSERNVLPLQATLEPL